MLVGNAYCLLDFMGFLFTIINKPMDTIAIPTSIIFMEAIAM